MENKRPKMDSHENINSNILNSILQQVATPSNSLEQYIDAEQLNLINNAILSSAHNRQPNVVYIIVPTNPLPAQEVQTVLLAPKEGDVLQEPPQLHYYDSVNPNITQKKEPVEEDDDVVFIKQEDVSTDRDQLDPLQIQSIQDGNNINYNVIPQYEEADLLYELDHPKSTRYMCDFNGCLLTFSSFYERKIHRDTHMFPSNTEFKCSMCNMVFHTAFARNKHIDSHTIVNTFRCKDCLGSFPYYTTLVKHLSEHKCATKRSYPCQKCGVNFLTDQERMRHLLVDLKRCECGRKLCDKKEFTQHQTLCETHKQKDQGEKLSRVKRKANLNDIIILD